MTARICWYLSILITWTTTAFAYPELYVLMVGGILFLTYCVVVGIGSAYLTTRVLDAIFSSEVQS